MKEKKRNIVVGIIIAIVVLVFLVFGTLACLGTFRDFDAQGYVRAMLDKTLKGNVNAAAELLNGTTTEEALLAQYEATIESFAKSSLPKDMELTEEMENQYIDICKKVFASMKYDVQEAVKVSDSEYEVPVQYQPSDIFPKYNVLVEAESQRLSDKAYTGEEYRGTPEEINAKMEEAFTSAFCGMFEEAYNTMEFGEKQTFVLKVIKGEEDLYKLDTAQISEFIKKIVGLDAIQD